MMINTFTSPLNMLDLILCIGYYILIPGPGVLVGKAGGVLIEADAAPFLSTLSFPGSLPFDVQKAGRP